MLHQPRFCYKNLFPCYISAEKHRICAKRNSFPHRFFKCSLAFIFSRKETKGLVAK